MVFLTKLARLGTRHEITPTKVMLAHELAHPDRYQDYFGIPVRVGDGNSITFAAEDAGCPFLTENLRTNPVSPRMLAKSRRFRLGDSNLICLIGCWASVEQIRVRRGLVLGQLPAVVVVQDAGSLLTSLNEYSQQHMPAVYFCLTLRFITKHTLCA